MCVFLIFYRVFLFLMIFTECIFPLGDPYRMCFLLLCVFFLGDPYRMCFFLLVIFTESLFLPLQVFADLPSSYLLNPACVDKGEYIDHGSFGDIYHGAVYPSVTATVSEPLHVL